jgi:hypothetical protein
VLKTIRAGWQNPTEYDVTDANCLIEWIHGAVTKVVKRAMEEAKIDQEIDFKIQRGERQGLAGAHRPGEGEKKKSRFLGFKLRRES